MISLCACAADWSLQPLVRAQLTDLHVFLSNSRNPACPNHCYTKEDACRHELKIKPKWHLHECTKTATTWWQCWHSDQRLTDRLYQSDQSLTERLYNQTRGSQTGYTNQIRASQTGYTIRPEAHRQAIPIRPEPHRQVKPIRPEPRRQAIQSDQSLTDTLNQSDQGLTDRHNQSDQSLTDRLNQSYQGLTDRLNQSDQGLTDRLNQSDQSLRQAKPIRNDNFLGLGCSRECMNFQNSSRMSHDVLLVGGKHVARDVTWRH